MAAYFILHCQVHDLDKLRQYQAGARPTLVAAGAEVVVFDAKTETVEGESPGSSTVILKFDDIDAAKAWYNSPGYQAVLGLRQEAADGIALFAQSPNPG